MSGEREVPGAPERAGASLGRPLTAHGSPLTAREGQTLAGQSLLVRYVNFVKLAHTLFALPFAMLGVLEASLRTRVTPRMVLLVLIAFSSARLVDMGFNRIVDCGFDARNPRTSNREMPRGALSLMQVSFYAYVAVERSIGSATALNRLCFLC